jgi:hypothetical protein
MNSTRRAHGDPSDRDLPAYRDDRGEVGIFAGYCHIAARPGLTGSRCSNARKRSLFRLRRHLGRGRPVLGRSTIKKIKPHSSSTFSDLVTLALKICRFVDLLTEAEVALLMRNQTKAPAAECAPLHGGAPLDFRNSESRIRRRPFSFR